jgi:hypothetical protein
MLFASFAFNDHAVVTNPELRGSERSQPKRLESNAGTLHVGPRLADPEGGFEHGNDAGLRHRLGVIRGAGCMWM